MNNYDDIINLEHPTSKVHPRMSIDARSAQFAPFAALAGYNDEVKEKARLTDEKINLDEDELTKINLVLEEINNNIKSRPMVSITYFIPDEKKNGGRYETIVDQVKRIDDVALLIKLENNIINISDILFIKIIK